MNKKLLLVCYYFPPLGLGGVGRPLNLFRRLPTHGWDCHVLTVKPVAYRSFEPELLAQLDTSRIHRAGSLDPQRILYLLGVHQIRAATIARGRVISERFFPDAKIGWVARAVRLGRTLIENKRFDAILSTSPPISCHLVAERLAKEYRIPWVADFRDYWTVFKIEDSYTKDSFVRKGNQLKERIVVGASAITTVNKGIASYLRKGTVIRNAYDEELVSLWKVPAGGSTFTVGMVGHQEEFPSAQSLCAVLKITQNRNFGSVKPIHVIQVGRVDPDWLNRTIKESGAHVSIMVLRELKRTEMIAALSNCALLHFNVPRRAGHDIVPGKLYDLLASGRPLLVDAPEDSEVANIIRQTGAGMTYGESTLTPAAEFVCDLAKKHENGTLCIQPLPPYAREFGSDPQGKRFTELLNGIVG